MMEEILISDAEKNRDHRRWRKHPLIEVKKSLLIVLFLLVLVVIMLITSVIRKHYQDDNDSETTDSIENNTHAMLQSSICYSKECNITAERVLKFMNSRANPCEDFYEFACGHFVNKTVIPSDKSSVNMFSEVTDAVLEQLTAIVKEPITDEELGPFKSMKYLYRACMDNVTIENLGLEPMKRFLKKLGDWPLLIGEHWNETEFSWTNSVYTFRKYGFSSDYFLDLSVLPDFKNTSIRRIQISEPTLSLSREHFDKGINDSIVMEYYKYIVDIAVMFGANREFAEKEIKESLLFEMALANMTTPMEQHRDNLDKFHHPMTINEAQKRYPYVNWLEYINNILAPIQRVDESEIIIVNTPNFTTHLGAVLHSTPKRIQANYVMWRAVQSSISFLSENVRNRQQEFSAIKHGRTKRPPRWKECVNLACGSYHIASGSLYVQKYFKEESKKEAMELVHNIREEMYEILKSVDWMDETTRTNALSKAHGIVTHIAYPDELLDRDKIIDVYKDLNIEPSEYFSMIVNITKYSTDYSFRKLREPVNKTDWKTHSQADTVNAMYNPLENSIEFPAGIWQSVFFSKDRPKYMNYGAIGFIIGHEITHGFDDQGRQFDTDGNLRDWWDPKTEARYREKAKCIVNQYSNYTIEEVGIKLNGFNTQGENIADNGGIREAYKAYINWSKRNGAESQLPNLPYSPQQMFWISTASAWCEKSRPETLKYQIETAVHAPGRLRIIGAFSNQEEFSSDFKCPIGSKMNPIIKCKVW